MSIDECYTFKQYTYTDGIFQESIDATYIIYLQGSTRISNIFKQLEKYHPTNTVYILMNKGYKECKKSLMNNTTYSDLVDANMRIFQHAQENEYSNILVLEDDFIFSKEINNSSHINNISTFLLDNKDSDFIYQLGCAPIVSIPYNTYTYLTLSWAAHANIYSSKAVQTLLDDYASNKITGHIDAHIISNTFTKFNTYMYYTPLCYQVYTYTDNSATWVLPGPLKEIKIFFIGFFLWLLGIDKTPEPGTTILYTISKLLFFIPALYAIYLLVSNV